MTNRTLTQTFNNTLNGQPTHHAHSSTDTVLAVSHSAHEILRRGRKKNEASKELVVACIAFVLLLIAAFADALLRF